MSIFATWRDPPLQYFKSVWATFCTDDTELSYMGRRREAGIDDDDPMDTAQFVALRCESDKA